MAVVLSFPLFSWFCRMSCSHTRYRMLPYLRVSETTLNHLQDSTRFCLKVFSPQRLRKRYAVAEMGTNGLAPSLSSSWLSASLLTSRMHISGSDSMTGGREPRPEIPGGWVRMRWDEVRVEGNGRRGNQKTYGILPQFVEDIDRAFSDVLLRV